MCYGVGLGSVAHRSAVDVVELRYVQHSLSYPQSCSDRVLYSQLRVQTNVTIPAPRLRYPAISHVAKEEKPFLGIRCAHSSRVGS